MNSFWNWLVRNLSNIFSFFSIFLTLYFGTIYVPNWIEENRSQKSINAQIILEQSIKELGEHEVEIKLNAGVNATIKVNVVRAEA